MPGVVVGLVAWATLAQAQVNTEPLAAAATEEGVGFQFGFNGAWSAGNVSILDLRGDLAFQYRRNFRNREGAENEMRDRLIVSLRGSLLTVNGTQFFDNRLVHGRYTHQFTPRVGLELFSQYENNLLLLLDARITAGTALTLHAIKTPRVGLRLGLGPLLEHEIRNLDPEGPDPLVMTNPRLVWSLGLRAGIVKDRLTLLQTTYFEPRIDIPSDILLVSYTELQAPITKALTMNASLQVRHDTRSPTPLVSTDVRVGWGFRLRLAARPDPHEPH